MTKCYFGAVYRYFRFLELFHNYLELKIIILLGIGFLKKKMSFLPFYRGESICTADLDLIHERITKEDLADHGITVAILND